MHPQKHKLDIPTRMRLEQICRDPMSWTDGGHWMGTGTAPYCPGKTIIASNERKYTIEFKMRESAVLEWNEAVESNYNVAALAVGTFSFALNFMPIVKFTKNIISISGLLIGGGIGFSKKPTVLKGWSVASIAQNTLAWSSLSKEETFIQRTRLEVKNELGKIMYSGSNKVEFIPGSAQERELFERIAKLPSREKTVVK